MNNPDHCYFLDLTNHSFGLKYLNSLMRIRDPGRKNSDSGSGIEKFGSGMENTKYSDLG
jgi:hypothetical protein